MIYLNKGFCVPFAILLGIVFAPITTVGAISLFWGIQLPIFIAFVVCLAIYCVGVLLAYKSSKSKKYAMQEIEGTIIINYPNLNRESQELVLRPDAIVKLEYYRLRSVRAWGLLLSCLVPRCAFLTYVSDGKEVCKHIGYPNYQELRDFCRTMNIDLVNR